MDEKRDGPKVTLAFSCYGCTHLSSSSWSGAYHCNKMNLKRVEIASETPSWCPLRDKAERAFRDPKAAPDTGRTPENSP